MRLHDAKVEISAKDEFPANQKGFGKNRPASATSFCPIPFGMVIFHANGRDRMMTIRQFLVAATVSLTFTATSAPGKERNGALLPAAAKKKIVTGTVAPPTLPDVVKTPSPPAGPVPIPYPNLPEPKPPG